MAIILITGGSGLIGSALTALLHAEGHTVRHLTRASTPVGPIRSFHWDLQSGTLDEAALDGVDHIVHLAGAGIADKRWNTKRVQELIDSRTRGPELLRSACARKGHWPKSFISAAGIGYYGAITSDRIFAENAPPGSDTIGRISLEWEAAVDKWTATSRVVKLRTPVVLARKGPLAKLAAPARWGLGAALGTGHQWMPWVHIDDLARIYHQAITDDRMSGAYNVNVTEQINNRDFMRALAAALNRPFFLPAVPAFALKLALGELSSVLLEGSRANNDRLCATGFRFEYDTLQKALDHLLSHER